MKRKIKLNFNKPVYFFVLLGLLSVGIFFLFKPAKTVSVLNFGDVMFDRGVRNIIDNRGRDPFEYIKKEVEILRSYDFVIANLEGPIIEMDRADCQQKIYNFQFANNTTERLKSVGINILNIANNHSYDCYSKGFMSTKSILNKSGIDYIGDSDYQKSYVVKEINSKKIAFVGIDAVTSPIPVSGFYPLIKELKSKNDFVVVDIHWGTEYLLTHDDNQESIGHKLIDSGADVIFGHHPHVVEPVEVYKKGVIFYSLGNFVFDQDFGDTTVGLGAGVLFENRKMIFNIYPFNIKKFAPDFMEAKERQNYCEKYLKNTTHTSCSFVIESSK